MSADESGLSEVLAGHRILFLNAGGRTGCRGCTWTTDERNVERRYRAHGDHQAAAVLDWLRVQADEAETIRAVAAAIDAQMFSSMYTAQANAALTAFLAALDGPESAATDEVALGSTNTTNEPQGGADHPDRLREVETTEDA